MSQQLKTVSHTHQAPAINETEVLQLSNSLFLCLDQRLPPVKEMFPDHLIKPLGRLGELLQDGVPQVVGEHGLVVVLGLRGVMSISIARLIVERISNKDEALNGNQNLWYDTVNRIRNIYLILS